VSYEPDILSSRKLLYLYLFQHSKRYCCFQVDLLRWHPDGAVIAAAFGNGELLAFDSALQRIDFASDLRPSLDSLDLSGLHG
jgi:hypothetical protein